MIKKMPATNPASLPWLRSLVELMLEQLLRLVFPLLSVTRSLSLSLSCLTSLLLLAIFFLPRLVCWKWHVDFHVKAFLFAGLPACLPAWHPLCEPRLHGLSGSLLILPSLSVSPCIHLSNTRCLLHSSRINHTPARSEGMRDKER